MASCAAASLPGGRNTVCTHRTVHLGFCPFTMICLVNCSRLRFVCCARLWRRSIHCHHLLLHHPPSRFLELVGQHRVCQNSRWKRHALQRSASSRLFRAPPRYLVLMPNPIAAGMLEFYSRRQPSSFSYICTFTFILLAASQLRRTRSCRHDPIIVVVQVVHGTLGVWGHLDTLSKLGAFGSDADPSLCVIERHPYLISSHLCIIQDAHYRPLVKFMPSPTVRGHTP